MRVHFPEFEEGKRKRKMSTKCSVEAEKTEEVKEKKTYEKIVKEEKKSLKSFVPQPRKPEEAEEMPAKNSADVLVDDKGKLSTENCSKTIESINEAHRTVKSFPSVKSSKSLKKILTAGNSRRKSKDVDKTKVDENESSSPPQIEKLELGKKQTEPEALNIDSLIEAYKRVS